MQWFLLGWFGSHKKRIACYCRSCWVTATCCMLTPRPFVALDSRLFNKHIAGWLLSCELNLVSKHVCTSILWNLLRPPPNKPQKVRKKKCFLCRELKILKKENATGLGFKPDTWSSSCALRSLFAPKLWRLQFKISAPCIRHSFSWRLHAITFYKLNVSHSARFLLFQSNSQVTPQVQRIHAQRSYHPQSTDSMGDVLVSGWLLSCDFVFFCGKTRAHKHFVEPAASPFRWASKKLGKNHENMHFIYIYIERERF